MIPLLDALRQALTSYPCRCEFERKGNVPIWHPDDKGVLQRKRIHQCSRCWVLERWEIEPDESERLRAALHWVLESGAIWGTLGFERGEDGVPLTIPAHVDSILLHQLAEGIRR